MCLQWLGLVTDFTEVERSGIFQGTVGAAPLECWRHRPAALQLFSGLSRGVGHDQIRKPRLLQIASVSMNLESQQNNIVISI
jgi:hypothetical protein